MPLDDGTFYGMGNDSGGIPTVPVGTYGTGSQAAAGSGTAIVTERGGTTNQQTNISTTNTSNYNQSGNSGIIGSGNSVTTDNSSTLYDQSGNSGVIGSGNSITTNNNTLTSTQQIDKSIHTSTTINTSTDYGAISSAFGFADSALHGAIGAVQLQQQQTDAELNHLITYTSDAYTAGLNAVETNTNNVLNFFSTEVDQLQQSQLKSTAQLQNATVGAIGAAAQGVQSESAQQFTQLQGTLVKLAIGGAIVILAFAYLMRKH